MDSEMELQQAIYRFLLMQIQFGSYQYGESLPTLEETCRQFHISLDTAGPAYHRLRQEGYITLSKKAGAKVAIKYEPEEIEQHIQSFYAERENALTDLSKSMWPLLGQAQCVALKHASMETWDLTEQFCNQHIKAPFAVWEHLDHKYGVLGNELLMRLTRYLYLFFHGLFLGVVDNKQFKEKSLSQVQAVSTLCRAGNWRQLPDVLGAIEDEFSRALFQFYEQRISMPSPKDEVVFRWDAYKKSSQLRYSLAIELLTDINRGVYPVGSYLPPAGRLATMKGVSISTIRRVISLLNNIGAVKSSRPLGARVLPPAQSTENCDFTQPDIRRRLLDLTESLQIFALSSRAVSEITLASLDSDSLRQWKQRLHDLENRKSYDLAAYVSLELISKHAPYQAIRTIYSELLQLLFWGNPLRGMRGEPETVNLFFVPHFECMLNSLEKKEFHSFSSALESILLYELRVTVDELLQLGIVEVQDILVPDENELAIFE